MRIIRFVVFSAIGFVLVSCSRTENGAYIPESLPYSVLNQERGEAQSLGEHLDLCVAFDSARHADRAFCLSNAPAIAPKQNGLQAVCAEYTRAPTLDMQINFPPLRFPGLQRAALLPACRSGVDSSGAAFHNLFFFLQYPDSIVLAACNADANTDPWILDARFARPDNQYAIFLGLWNDPKAGTDYCVFRKSNRLVWHHPFTLDTLVFYDLKNKRAVCVPTAACYVPWGSYFSSYYTQSDSLFCAFAWPPENGETDSHFNDTIAYLTAFRPNGMIAWCDTLGTRNSGKYFATDFSEKQIIVTKSGESGPTGNTVYAVNRANGALKIIGDVPGDESPVPFIGAHGELRYIAEGARNREDIYDSAFTPITSRSLGVRLGGISLGTGSEDYTAEICTTGAETASVDGKQAMLLTTVQGQLLVVDYATLAPLAATPAYHVPLKYAFVRGAGGNTRLLVLHGSAIKTFAFSPNTPLARFEADGSAGVLVAVAALAFLLYGGKELYGWIRRANASAAAAGGSAPAEGTPPADGAPPATHDGGTNARIPWGNLKKAINDVADAHKWDLAQPMPRAIKSQMLAELKQMGVAATDHSLATILGRMRQDLQNLKNLSKKQ